MANHIVNQPRADLNAFSSIHHHSQGLDVLEQRMRLAKNRAHELVNSDGIALLSTENRYRLAVIVEQLDNGYPILMDLLVCLSH